ncbi:hypothetical protein [Winogradskyella haliclonae]|uniref:MORN repeat protein n=1 Tax=Winogradskyella haliclonae TaxID=2048558 RepID=A0ABQ2BVW1_9FLAO|nr:hypothetical protein [Winogradskyella haliclonae]GGI55707.1 hypothetical protein GCM10011444_00160 [Winogradskyella haliclonae]
MKKIISLLTIILTLNSFSYAQELNVIVPGTAKNIPDGWHKFTFQGTKFDVEVKAETLTEGNIVWFDQSIYSGSLKGYDISGKGTYVWPNRERYEGTFRNNMRHGKGTMFYKDGSRHYGKWKNNKKNGKGQEYNKSGELVKDGIWENDVFVKPAKAKKKKG